MKYINISNSDKKIIVDDEDYPLLSRHTWNKNKNRFPTTSFHGMQNNTVYNLPISRLINVGKNGESWYPRDGNFYNLQKSNLVSIPFNSYKQTVKKITYYRGRKVSSGYKGVSFNSKINKYRAYIKTGKKQIALGVYLSEKDAALAYNKKAKELFGEYAYQNKIED